jgi:hypothetical protein
MKSVILYYPVKTCFTILLLIIINSTYSQETDTISSLNLKFLTDQLENIAQSHEGIPDYSDLIDDYVFYSQNPININGTNIEILRDIYIINDIQLNNLRLYISNYGQLMSIYELTSVSSFDNETIKRLQPFVSFESSDLKDNYKIRDAFKYGRHNIISRYDQVLEKKKGYHLHPDSAISYPGSVYLGDPQHYYLRYSFNYNNIIKAGFTLDKDAGEPFIRNNLNDSVKSILSNYNNYGYDFLSAYAYLQNFKFIDKIIIGDYHLEFGQGLTLWSGLSFGKSADAVNIRKFPVGIRPNTSANENRFFRGIAASVKFKSVYLTAFVSSNDVDGNLVPVDVGNYEGISSIIETGLHRTINEILDRNVLNIKTYGGNITYKLSKFSVALTYYKSEFSKQLIKSNELYKLYDFQGQQLSNFGADVAYNFKLVNFFGEISRSSNGGIAGIAGINTFLNDRFFLSLLYHSYAKDYHNIYNNPFAESSRISNEAGCYLGYKILLRSKISVSGYIDHFWFPWLKYRVSSPSVGKDYLIQLNYNNGNNTSAYIRYRFKNKQENRKLQDKYMPSIDNISRNDIRLSLSYEISDFIVMKNRVDIVIFKANNSINDKGYMIYQDVLYRPEKFPVQLSLRYNLFNTDSYYSRIYTYENDVLYAFSVPSFFNSGQRWYIMTKWKVNRMITLWLRYAKTTYFNQTTIGSGNELIDGNFKSEIKVQLRVKL